MMGSLLTFHVHANGHSRGRTVWWSLLRHARQIGIPGGSAFRAIAGFGLHHQVNLDKSLTDFSSLAMEVGFLVTLEQARELLEWAGKMKVRLLYTLTPAKFGSGLKPDVEAVEPDLTEGTGRCLSFYVHESDRHGGVRLYLWLLMQALSLGLPGGTATQTVAGFGRHRSFHDAGKVDLLVDLAVRVDFFLSEQQAGRLLRSVQETHPGILFQVCPAQIGTTVESSVQCCG